MANPRQRKKSRSSIGRKTMRTKDDHKKLVLRAHPIMNKYWDTKLSMKENYKKFGLAVNLNGENNYSAKPLETAEERRERLAKAEESQFEIKDNETDPAKIPLGQARLIRDEEGNVKEIIYGKMESEPQPEEPKNNDIIDEMLEYEQTRPRIIKEVFPSERENSWLFALHEKYGDDYDAMMKDRKLNQMLFSAGQLKRKFKVWKKFNQMS